MAKELVSYREFARRINVNESAVRKAIGAGHFTKGVNILAKKIDPAAAAKDAWVQKQQVVKPKAGVSRAKAIEKIEKQEAASRKPQTAGKTQKPAAGKQKSTLSTQLSDRNKQLDEEETDSPEEEVFGSEDELLEEIRIYKNMPVKEAMRLREVFGAALDKLKLLEQQGTLVKRSEVEKSLYAFGNQFKKALQSYPQRVIDNVLAAPNKIEAINVMNEEMNIILNQFSNAAAV